jgi:hypothetical protein
MLTCCFDVGAIESKKSKLEEVDFESYGRDAQPAYADSLVYN